MSIVSCVNEGAGVDEGTGVYWDDAQVPLWRSPQISSLTDFVAQALTADVGARSRRVVRGCNHRVQ